MYTICVIDDEKDIVNALEIYLSSEGYHILKGYNGQDALRLMRSELVHLVLMDIMMPEMDGIQAMVEIRKHSNVPVILLTAKSEDTDKILGLNIGADDYITKPFNPVEVIARVKSQLRRYMTLGTGKVSAEHYQIEGLFLDDKAKKVSVDGEEVRLTPTEYQMLLLFMQNPNTVFSPKDIYEAVWEEFAYGAEGTVAVHIRHLREKIEINPSDPRYLKVIWGQGYVLEKKEGLDAKNSI